MDIASILGLIICIVLVLVAIVTGDEGVVAIMNFVDVKSALITIGGTLGALLVMAPSIPAFINRLKSIGLVMKTVPLNEEGTIKQIIEFANLARKEGLLAVEEKAGSVDDDFLKKGILLTVDGTDPELVRSILETEIACIDTRHKEIITFWEDFSSMGPAWGMIGTLVGLVNMLKNMGDDSSAIGPSMAIALITTLYGSLVANWICTPIANKLKANNANEIMMKEIMVEGLLSIQAGENPRVIEEKLKSFIAPSKRDIFAQSEGGGDVG